jgi:hypothetical protein
MPVGLTSVALAAAVRGWKLTNAAMEMIGMPLARGPRSAFVALVNGVHFELRDDCLSRMISCSITRGALADLAGRPSQ